MGIEQVGTADPMRECLAIVAVADHAIDGLRRCVRDEAADFSATAAQLRSRGHVRPCFMS
jgi:hypothetical protein